MTFAGKSTIAALLLAASTLGATVAHAATMTTYTDRAAFEAALASFTVDTMDGIEQYTFAGTKVRPGYSLSTNLMYGCINHAGCGNNALVGFDNAYLWNYTGADTFTFDSAVNGFGFTYSNPNGYSGAFPILEGFQAQSKAGFFGVISSDLMTTFSVDQDDSFMLMDNLTFGVAASTAVPEPTMPALLGISLLALGLSRRFSKK
jgi:hypothetical protein